MRFFLNLGLMTALFAFLCAFSTSSLAASTQGPTGTLRSSTDLSVYDQVSNAGQVLNLPETVYASIGYRVVLGRLTVKGWASEEVCEEWGPSPNGEPEFAECLRYSHVWSPKIVLANTRLFSSWALADLRGRSSSAEDLDVSSCIKGRDSLKIKQETQPSQPVPTLTLDRNCQVYVYDGKETKAVSAALANSDVTVEVKLGTFLNFALPNDLTIEGTLDEASQAALESGFTTDASDSQIIFDAWKRVRGETIRLLNFPGVVYFN